ncbi:MAG: hypothetical protein RSE94_01985 [Pseudomonas sp.]
MTRFEQFQQNVQRWATERGIYEHSTALAQALKAVSEVGKLCDAVIKNDRDALIDAIGDTAVCLVNLKRMCAPGPSLDRFARVTYQFGELNNGAAVVVLQVAECLDYADPEMQAGPQIRAALDALGALADCADLDFDDCCESAWQTIKSRTGRMVEGGAFVKD